MFCCCCFEWDCCKKYWPEWYNEELKKAVWCRIISMIVIWVILQGGIIALDAYVFDTSTITWETIIALTVFFFGLSLLFVIYSPFQHKMFSWAIKISVIIIYVGFGGYLIINDLIKGETDFETDATCLDIWTVIHFLAGPFFAFLLPHWWTLLIITMWEVLEYTTTGLGDEEIFCNRVVDIVVAWVGWWILVLLFIRHYIPWFSSKNAYDEWLKDNPEKDQQQSNVSDVSDSEQIAIVSDQ